MSDGHDNYAYTEAVIIMHTCACMHACVHTHMHVCTHTIEVDQLGRRVSTGMGGDKIRVMEGNAGNQDGFVKVNTGS